MMPTNPKNYVTTFHSSGVVFAIQLAWVRWRCHHGPPRTTAHCNLRDVSFSPSFVENLAPDEHLISSSTVPEYPDTVKRYCVVALSTVKVL